MGVIDGFWLLGRNRVPFLVYKSYGIGSLNRLKHLPISDPEF